MKSIFDFYKMKQSNNKISMITCYDYTSALLLEKSGVDCILVGDSAAMVMHGFDNTTHATLDMMIAHTRAVSRGLQRTFLIADLPFMSYRHSLEKTTQAVAALIQAGAHAVKLEGADSNIETIQHIVASGVPVMGHIGLTPQHIHSLGGFKVQGKTHDAAKKLIQQAKDCEAAGCFAMVLECVPSAVAQQITQEVSIATIGIGAGEQTDGQVLVYQDLLGMQSGFKPKFVKHFLAGEEVISASIAQFISDVKHKKYPSKEHSYASSPNS